jgi:hypothetical protein
MPEVSLVPSDFIPTSSFSGGEQPTILRGKNAVIRAQSGRAKIESYPGSKDLGENYDLTTHALTGTLAWNTASPDQIVGTGTLFTTELRPGQMFLMGTEVFVVRSTADDTHLTVERPPLYWNANQAGLTGYRHPTMFEINRQRGVMRRGNAIVRDKKDIYLAGDGLLYLNGVSTGFTATHSPKRLARQVDGTYIENPLGFATVPTVPDVVNVAGGTKLMQAGKYSQMFSWYNTANKGFSNPSALVKQHAAADITLTAGQRFEGDFTATFSAITFVDADVTIATGDIHHVAHGRATGDVVKVVNVAGAIPVPTTGALLAGLPLYVIRIDADNFKLSRTNGGAAIVFASAAGGGTNLLLLCPAQANAILVWGSQSGGGVTAVNDSNFAQGAWLKASIVKLTDLDASIKARWEYLDAEMGQVATGNNDAAPECEAVSEFANQLFCISALGAATTAKPLGTSPGNYVLMEKPSNPEGFPPEWRVSVGDTITGFANGVGRMFCLTPTGLPFVTPTGRTELARLSPTLLDMPFTSRPFWTKGGISPDNVIVVQGDVFVYTGRSLLRSPSSADDNNVVPYEIGLPVADLTASWFDGHVLVKHDPKNQQICLISSASKQNASGYWVSEILPYSLQKNQWQPIIELSSTTRDMIVSGGATVNNRLELLAGGRVAASTPSAGTFRYDEPDGNSVSWYIAFQPSDLGVETRQKYIKWLRVTGNITGGHLKVIGARAGGAISITDIENGTNALATINLTDTAALTRGLRIPYSVKRLQIFTVRIDGTAAAGSTNRLDELAIDTGVHGKGQ